MEQIALPILASVATAFITWLLSRQKSKVEIEKMKAETAKVDLNNIETAVDIWRKLATDLHQELQKVYKKCEQLTLEIEALRKENKQLKQDMHNLQKSINENVKP